MGQANDPFLQIIGIRRRERDRREAEARLAHDAFAAAELAMDEARHAVEAACRTCENAQRARATAPCDALVADYVRAESDRLDACKQDAAACAATLEEARRALVAARIERQRAQAKLDVLENEHAAIQVRERRRGERKREDALPLGLMPSPC